MAQCLRVGLRTDSLGSTLGLFCFLCCTFLLRFEILTIFFPFSLFPFILIAALCTFVRFLR